MPALARRAALVVALFVLAPLAARSGIHDTIVGKWLWKFPDDNSIWGPEPVEIKENGVAAFGRDKTAVTWQREGAGKYLFKWATGDTCHLTLVDRDHLDGLYANGMIVKPVRESADAPPPAAPVAAPQPIAAPPPPVAAPPPPPPPAPVVDENASRLIKTNKRVYRKGEPVVVTYTGMPGAGTDWTNVIKADVATDEWGNWEYVSGANGQRILKDLAPGQYEARAYFNGSTNVEDKVAFTVTP